VLSYVELEWFVCRLAEVGVLETPKLQGKYDAGQVGMFFSILLSV
jgi:hypothetical protein